MRINNIDLDVFCDMTTEAGGWLVTDQFIGGIYFLFIMKIVHEVQNDRKLEINMHHLHGAMQYRQAP